MVVSSLELVNLCETRKWLQHVLEVGIAIIIKNKIRLKFWLLLFIDISVDTGFQRSVFGFWSKMADEEGRKFQLIRPLLWWFLTFYLTFHVIIVMFEPKSEKDKETERKRQLFWLQCSMFSRKVWYFSRGFQTSTIHIGIWQFLFNFSCNYCNVRTKKRKRQRNGKKKAIILATVLNVFTKGVIFLPRFSNLDDPYRNLAIFCQQVFKTLGSCMQVLEQLQNAGPLRTTCFTYVKFFWRTKHNTIGTFVIQWDVNKWPCIL